jgi:hypothetical protein
MAKKTVLAIGIEPSLVDFSAFPGLTAESVTSYIQAQIERLRAMGYDADSCLIDLGGTAELSWRGRWAQSIMTAW